ncbi:MAG TPA: Gmad2 immunoglobulin-like domain-containing protein [Intrasporangium sp.]|uniref:Gmad2 immunoglobulin-like domain-containing protein n=1 Tax=Intrasporangium sp. TaxID=1925024 RepID=UPI002B487819|nr:Gmad2 immunoglobulin-like domain-containing protein [Intrasporangium sp.]HKX66799.1 Gmad2 immunoglobulin-like domain-containing protein [Intrasporangium sp.]
MNPDDSRRRTDPDAEPVVIGADLRAIEAGLRDALADDARSFQPGERLDAILSAAHEAGPVGGQHPSGQQRWTILAAAAAVALVAGGTLWLAGRPDAPPPAPSQTTSTNTAAPSPSPTTPRSPSPSPPIVPVPPTAPPTTGAATTDPPQGSIDGIPVYWIGQTGGAPRLFREFRTVPDTGGQVDSAVTAMTAMQPRDPDYLTPWRPASRVEVTRQGDGLTVDLSADAISGTNVGSELADRAVQQLVYTATAAAQMAGTPVRTVTILVDGQPAEAWGAVQLGDPIARAPQAEVQSHVWVLVPEEGQRLSTRRVQFRGFGTSFEANFLWQITRQGGTVVAEGNAMGGTGTGGFGEFAFEHTLPAGDYVVRMSTDDPSGGAEGGGAHVDTKSFTVR